MSFKLSRWKLKPNQGKVFLADKRFVVLVAGRRWAKTTTALLRLFKWAGDKKGLWGYFAPTYRQAKLIAWEKLKEIVTPDYRIGTPNESELFIKLRNGSIIRLFGVDNPDSLRGPAIAGGIADEYDQWKNDVYEKVIRPAISDSQGPFWFIGSPDSRKRRLRQKFEEVEMLQREGKSQDWGAFKFRSSDGGYIPKEEIEKAKRELDERTFREEYEASFEDINGRVYYGFSLQDNVVTLDPHRAAVEYNPRLPIRVYFDFNVDPFCVSVGHHIPRIDDFRNAYWDVHVFDEIVLRNSNTPEACKALLERFGSHASGIYVYGDAAGKSRSTTSSLSDYQIIVEYFKNIQNKVIRFKAANPHVKDRVNAVNAKLKSADGTRHLFIHPRCKKLIRDFMGVTYKEGTTDIDKSDLELTHLTDGLGYGIDFEFPVIKNFVRS